MHSFFSALMKRNSGATIFSMVTAAFLGHAPILSAATYLDSGWAYSKVISLNTTPRQDTTVEITGLTIYPIKDTIKTPQFIDGEISYYDTSYTYDSLHPYEGFDTVATIETHSLGTVNSFPLLIRLTQNNFNFTQSLISGGGDLRFAKSNGSALTFQIEHWDSVAAHAEIWVKIDTVYGNNATQYFVMYWGKSGVVSTSNGAEVFDTASGFTGVWHLSEAGTTTGVGVYKDATNNGFHANNPVSHIDTTGLIGRCPYLNGTDSFTTASSTKFGFDSTDNFMASGWMYCDTLDYSLAALVGATDGTSWFSLGKSGLGRTSWFWDAGRSVLVTGGEVSPNLIYHYESWHITPGWHYVVGIQNQNMTNKFQLWIDGEACWYSRNGINASMNAPLKIGAGIEFYNGYNYYGFLKGRADEVRIEKGIARSADWIMLCYETQKANQTVVSIGGPTSGVIARNTFSPNSRQTLNVSSTLFNRSVSIKYSIAENENGSVQISIHDIMGRNVWQSRGTQIGPGTRCVLWDGQDSRGIFVGRGVYIVRLILNNASSKNLVISSKQITYMP